MSGMFAIEFRLNPNFDGDISGLVVGDIYILTSNAVFTSAHRRPDQSMMLLISMVSLLDTVRSMKNNMGGKRREFIFVGADSSFMIKFVKNGMDIDVLVDGVCAATVSLEQLAAAVGSACRAFYSAISSRITDSAYVKDDVSHALCDFAVAYDS